MFVKNETVFSNNSTGYGNPIMQNYLHSLL